MNSPKDYLTDRVADTEKQLKGYFSFNGKSPVEVIFSAGVNDTTVVLTWSVFVKAIESLLTQSIEQSMEVGIEIAVNKLSGKPTCTEDSPCGCHMGEVFHADSTCNCDLVEELLKLLSPKL